MVNVSSIAGGEYAENEVRKDFSPIERVAIADAVSRDLGNRQGNRTDKLLHRCQKLMGGPREKSQRNGLDAPRRETRQVVDHVANWQHSTQPVAPAGMPFLRSTVSQRMPQTNDPETRLIAARRTAVSRSGPSPYYPQ